MRQLLADNDIDVLCLSETWLKPCQSNTELNIENYDLIRSDRSTRRGGGVAVYVKISDRLTIDLNKAEDCYNYQFLHISVKQIHCKVFHLMVCYRPPNTQSSSDNQFIGYLQTITEEDVVVGGDFNIDFISHKSDQWFENMKDLGFIQKIKGFTRVTETSQTCIDHIYIRSAERFSNYGTINYEIADHKPTFITRKTIKPNAKSVKSITFKDWNNFNTGLFEELVPNLMNKITDKNDINSSVELFNNNLIELCKKCVPTKTIRISSKNLPYMTSRIKNNITKRNKLKAKINKMKRFNFLDKRLINEYKRLRNSITSDLRQSKRKWFEKKFNDNKNNVKNVWKFISQVMDTKNPRKDKRNWTSMSMT